MSHSSVFFCHITRCKYMFSSEKAELGTHLRNLSTCWPIQRGTHKCQTHSKLRSLFSGKDIPGLWSEPGKKDFAEVKSETSEELIAMLFWIALLWLVIFFVNAQYILDLFSHSLYYVLNKLLCKTSYKLWTVLTHVLFLSNHPKRLSSFHLYVLGKFTCNFTGHVDMYPFTHLEV